MPRVLRKRIAPFCSFRKVIEVRLKNSFVWISDELYITLRRFEEIIVNWFGGRPDFRLKHQTTGVMSGTWGAHWSWAGLPVWYLGTWETFGGRSDYRSCRPNYRCESDCFIFDVLSSCEPLDWFQSYIFDPWIIVGVLGLLIYRFWSLSSLIYFSHTLEPFLSPHSR